MNDSIKLKPCPFCGCSADSKINIRGQVVVLTIKCRNCSTCKESSIDFLGIDGVDFNELNATENDLIAQWNRRYKEYD